MSRFDDRLADYVEVKDRIRLFYAAYPDGRLTTTKVRWELGPDGKPRVIVAAAAYRTPDDPQPGRGWSSLELPGSTPYTRGSELENAETSAWGRAIGALGIGIDKSIASAQEVASRAHDAPERPETAESAPDGLIGTIEAGKAPVDLFLRTTPDGAVFGFKLRAGRKAYQVLAHDGLATALALVGPKVGARAQVHGAVEMVPWERDGKAMPPYARINAEAVSLDGVPVVAAEPETEAPSVPAFSEDELAAVGIG